MSAILTISTKKHETFRKSLKIFTKEASPFIDQWEFDGKNSRILEKVWRNGLIWISLS